MSKVGILGGTFNPVHIGHLRHALEVGEALRLDQVLLSPNSIPPLKTGRTVLPYELRLEMLRAAVDGIALLGVSDLEGELTGPSYTYLVLREWRRRNPDLGKPWFMMGVEDFAILDRWYNGLQLVRETNLIVVPRGGEDRDRYHTSLKNYWPEARAAVKPDLPAVQGLEAVETADGLCVYLPVPRLDVSSSFIRNRWRQGRDISGLVPAAPLQILREHDIEVQEVWRKQEA